VQGTTSAHNKRRLVNLDDVTCSCGHPITFKGLCVNMAAAAKEVQSSPFSFPAVASAA